VCKVADARDDAALAATRSVDGVWMTLCGMPGAPKPLALNLMSPKPSHNPKT